MNDLAKRYGFVFCVWAAACSQAPALSSVRDVRPARVELGEKLVVETSVPLAVDAATQVRLDGFFHHPGGSAKRRSVILRSARATAPGGQEKSTRVLADADSLFEEEVGGHARFSGTVSVLVEGEVVADSGKTAIELDLFPRSVRSFALKNEWFGGRANKELFDWLGLTLAQEATPKGVAVQAGTVLKVLRVKQAFNGLKFIDDSDCGVWYEDAKKCKGGLDNRVHRGEALAAGVNADLFDEIDGNGDQVVDRAEAHHRDSGASPAAEAGIREGDYLVSAAGRPVSAVGNLADAWAAGKKDASDRVMVGLLRAGVPMEVALPRHGQPASLPQGFLLVLVLVLTGLLVILPVPVLGGFIVVWERKVAGRMQSRPGPNRVGPGGWLQWLADGVKLIVKEDIVPTDSDSILFRLSPYLVFMGVFATFVVLPFSQKLIVADLNIGILYLLSVTSLVVVGIIMGGWASNSKWSLLGGMRSAAQIISYELPASIAVLSVVVLAGTLSTQGLVLNQGGSPWHWHLFDNPFTFACFFIYFISALAEGNRTPFDLPEAESELVSGYNTEYSGFRFSIFFLAEWVNLLVISAVATTVFLGGWRIPGVTPEATEANGWLQFLSFLVFSLKTIFLIFVIIWIRWTLPRFRVDQMMNMCWKYFLPISMVSFLAVSAWVWLAPYPSILRTGMRVVMFVVLGLGTLAFFISRVRYTQRTTKVLDLRGA